MAMLRFRLRQMEALLDRLAVGRRRSNALGPRRLQTAQDVVDLVQEQVDAVRRESGAGSLEKARAIGYLAGIARRAIETGKLADRLELLELVLKNRKDNGNS